MATENRYLKILNSPERSVILPRYIIDLVVRVSMETIGIVEKLPGLNEW